jgi:hypothetical protein
LNIAVPEWEGLHVQTVSPPACEFDDAGNLAL